jgi:hypothetical protein
MNTEISISVKRLYRTYAIMLCFALPALVLEFLYTAINLHFSYAGPDMNIASIFISVISTYLILFLAFINLVLIILNFMKMKQIDTIPKFKPIAIANVTFSTVLLIMALVVGVYIGLFLGFWEPFMAIGILILFVTALMGIIANTNLISCYHRKGLREGML